MLQWPLSFSSSLTSSLSDVRSSCCLPIDITSSGVPRVTPFIPDFSFLNRNLSQMFKSGDCGLCFSCWIFACFKNVVVLMHMRRRVLSHKRTSFRPQQRNVMQWNSWLWCWTCSVYPDSTPLSYVCRHHWDYGAPVRKERSGVLDEPRWSGKPLFVRGKAWWNLRTLCFGFFLNSFFTRRMFPADVVTIGRIGRCPFWSLKVPLSRV